MFVRLKNLFETKGMQRRLLLVISLLILCSVLLISFFSYLRFVSDYTSQSAKATQQLVEQVALNVDNYLDELARLCLSPYYSIRIMNQLETEAVSEQEELGKRREIEDYLRQVMTTPRKDILSVYIFTDAVYSITRTGHSDITSQYTEEIWYQEALQTDEYIFLPVSEQSSSSSRLIFSIVKRICSLQDSTNILGVIRVDANYSGIKAVCDRVNVNAHGALLITDAQGNLI